MIESKETPPVSRSSNIILRVTDQERRELELVAFALTRSNFSQAIRFLVSQEADRIRAEHPEMVQAFEATAP